MKELHLLISGVVQGVGYRYFIEREAQAFGLTGFVRNTADGKVEIGAQGPEDTLKVFVEIARRGPRGAEVLHVDEEWRETGEMWDTFTIEN